MNMVKKLDKLIRTINLKLCPTSDQIQILNKFINEFGTAHDIAVNEIINTGRTKTLGIEGAKTSFLYPQEKAELRLNVSKYSFSDNKTMVESAIGQNSATSYIKQRYKKIERDIKYKETQINKIIKSNPKILNVKSVYFTEIKPPQQQTCTICGKEGLLRFKSNEFPEYVCTFCFQEFRNFKKEIKNVQRNSFKFIPLYEEYINNNEVSDYFKKIIQDNKNYKEQMTQKKTIRDYCFCRTSSDKVLNWHDKHVIRLIDFEHKLIHVRIKQKDIIQVSFNGENYYTNFPKYGYQVKSNKYKKLIHEHLNDRAGNSYFIRKICNGKTEFFLSIPTHYPISKDIYPTGGCIIVSSRFIFIYTPEKMMFIKVHNNYMRKIIYKQIQSKYKKNNINLPNRFLNNNLAKYIRFQTHLLSRQAVQTAKKMSPNTSFLLVDYKDMVPDKDVTTPIVMLNDQIKNKLQYDGIYDKSITHFTLRENMICPYCNEIIPERDHMSNNRIVFRDTINSKVKKWEYCDHHEINPFIIIAKNMLRIGTTNAKI